MASTRVEECAPGVYRLRTLMVNVFFVAGDDGSWTLIDTGLRGYARSIEQTAEELFPARKPAAILLTHAHFDHVGGLPVLAERWGVPVYVHPLELPYVTGRSSYQPPDPTAGGGAWSLLSPLFPRGPIDLGPRAVMLPQNGSVPGLIPWRWVPTPGHSPGHVSFFRDSDRILIAGDAVVTTRQESLTHVIAQKPVVWRPPAYFTADWDAAHDSIERIAELEPEVLATGHGPAMRGERMRHGLQTLADRFAELRPVHGRYGRSPAVSDERGMVRIPPPTAANRALTIGAAGAVAALVLWAASPRGRA